MQRIRTYGSYEQANDDQITLLASHIDAVIEYVPAGPAELAHLQATPGYALLVEEERVDQAIELLSLVADPNHVSMVRCSRCGSDRAKQQEIDVAFVVITCGLAFVLFWIESKILGVPFICGSCGARFRFKAQPGATDNPDDAQRLREDH